MPKIITAAAPGLVVGGVESRFATFGLKVEVACTVIQGQEKILRIRQADGRWVSTKTWARRCEALGITLDFSSLALGERGPHTPSYGAGG